MGGNFWTLPVSLTASWPLKMDEFPSSESPFPGIPYFQVLLLLVAGTVTVGILGKTESRGLESEVLCVLETGFL